MTNTVLIKRSSTANAVPSAGNLQSGELAINYNDGNLFYKNASNVVTVIASNQFVSVSGNISGGNALITGLVSASGNVIGNYIIGDGSQLTGLPAGYANSDVANYLASGTLTSVVNLTNSSNVSLGTVGNVHISGGSSGYILSTDGSGNLSWIGQSIGGSSITVDDFTGNGVQSQFTLSVTPPNIDSTTVNYNGIIQLRTTYSLSGANIIFPDPPAAGASIEVTTISVNIEGSAGTNTQVQFNDGGGNFGASAAFTFNNTTNTLSITNVTSTGLISSTGNIAGNYIFGNGSQLTGLPEQYGNSNVAAYLASGADTQPISTSGNITGNYFIGNGSQLTGLPEQYGNSNVAAYLASGSDTQAIVTTGNISSGNVLTSGMVSATGNITGSTGIFNNGLSVTGDITATGNLNYQNVTDLVVGDPIIYIGADNIADLVDLGIVASANVGGLYQHLGFARDHTDAVWKLFGNVVAEPTTVIDWANAVYQSFLAGNVSSTGTVVSTGNITGGNIRTNGIVSAAGNITANYFIGNGSQLTGLPEQYSNTNVAAYLASGSDTQAIVTSGNINGGNLITSGLISSTGNVQSGNILTSGLISSTGNITSGNLITGGLISSTGNVQSGNILTSGLISSTGNITSGNLITGGLISSAGNITSGNLITGGLISSTGNVQSGNILTVGVVSATGNVTGNYLFGNGAFISGLPAGYANSDVANYLASGTDTQAIVTSGNISGGNLLTTGIVSSAGINSSGTVNLVSSGNISLGNVGNVHITGGTNGYILSTDGSGGLSWINAYGSNIVVDEFTANGVQTEFTLSVTPYSINDTTVNYNGVVQLRTSYTLSGANVVFPTAPTAGYKIEVSTISVNLTAAAAAGNSTQVQYNDAGALGAGAGFTFDKTANAVAVTGNITGGNLITSGILSVTGTGTVNFASASNVSLGSVGNVKITGGTTGQLLSTDGAGNLSFATVSTTIGITNDTSTNATYYPTLTTATSGSIGAANVSSTKLYYNPSTGQLNATDFNSLSDATFKTNIEPIINGMVVVASIEPVSFNWIDTGRKAYGVVAQDIEKVLPEIVSTGPDGKKSVSYDQIIPFLLSAIKELNAEIQDLKKKL